METLPFLFVVVLVVCLMPSALAIKCYECTNIPGSTGSAVCSDNADNLKTINCEPIFDRCITLTGTVTVPDVGPLDIELRNCSSSILCNPDSSLDMCNLLNDTTGGVFTKCNADCCQGDLCNGNGNGNGTGRISGLLASFVAILLALFLNL
ncbi:uncharacterized protein LOC144628916 isoform X1 [Oculina patagonica]